MSRLKIISNKILYWLNLSIIALVLTSAILLSSVYFIGSHFAKYRHLCEQFASRVLQHPVQIGEINLGSHNLEPVLRLHHIVIFNDTKTKKLLQAEELQIGIDLLGSVFKWQIKPSLLRIRGSELTVYQERSGKIKMLGMSNDSLPMVAGSALSPMLDEITALIFERSRIDLENVTLKWCFADGSNVQFTDLNIGLHNDALQHELKIRGKLVTKEHYQTAALFAARLKIHGDLLKVGGSHLSGDVAIENCRLNFLGWQFSQKKFFVSSGEVNLLVKHSTITTGIFRQPIVISGMESKVIWQDDQQGLKLSISGLKFIDNWLNISGGGQLLFTSESVMPIVDIKLSLKLSDLAQAKLYYPTTLLPDDATSWLDQAFIRSKTFEGDVILQGPLANFPFDHHEGKFLADINIRNVSLNYDPAWPRIDNISGKLLFAGRSLAVLAQSSTIMGEPTRFIQATIPDLEFPVLHVVGSMEANSSTGLKFVNASPLKNTIGTKLKDIDLAGRMQLELKIDMPLSDEIVDKDTKVDGNIELSRGTIVAKAWGLNVEDFSGKLHFDQENLKASDLRGKLFNQPIDFSIDTLKSKDKKSVVTKISITGNATVQDFEQSFSLYLAPYVVGNFTYQILLDLHDIPTQNIFQLSSDLRGVAIKLPPPLTKEMLNPSSFVCRLAPGKDQISQLAISYNHQVHAALALKKNDAKKIQILSGEIKFGKSPAQVPTGRGLIITGNLQKLDWPEWKKYLVKFQENATTPNSFIKQIRLKIGKLCVLDRVFKDALLRVRSQSGGWEVEFLLSGIDGKIYFPDDHDLPIRGEFEKLYFSRGPALSKPQDLLPLDFKINNFCFSNRCFNQVQLVTKRIPGGTKISNLTFSDGDEELNVAGEGEWLMVDGKQSSAFRGKIESNNVGNLLKQWALTDNVLSGSGEATFALKWPNSPANPSLRTINATFAINISDGRIINLNQQTENRLRFSNVLNLLSLQSLPRRLSLDFSDLTQKGFAFNTVVGDFELAGGNITIRQLELEGAAAQIKVLGRIGLPKQDYDLKLNVIPHVSTTLPVATTAAILGGPVAGAAGLVADNLLNKVTKKMVKKITSYDYYVTGPWENPNVTKS